MAAALFGGIAPGSQAPAAPPSIAPTPPPAPAPVPAQPVAPPAPAPAPPAPAPSSDIDLLDLGFSPAPTPTAQSSADPFSNFLSEPATPSQPTPPSFQDQNLTPFPITTNTTIIPRSKF